MLSFANARGELWRAAGLLGELAPVCESCSFSPMFHQETQAARHLALIAMIAIISAFPAHPGVTARRRLTPFFSRQFEFLQRTTQSRPSQAGLQFCFQLIERDVRLGYMTPAAFVSQCAPSVRATPSLQGHTAEPFTQAELS